MPQQRWAGEAVLQGGGCRVHSSLHRDPSCSQSHVPRAGYLHEAAVEHAAGSAGLAGLLIADPDSLLRKRLHGDAILRGEGKGSGAFCPRGFAPSSSTSLPSQSSCEMLQGHIATAQRDPKALPCLQPHAGPRWVPPPSALLPARPPLRCCQPPR